jgi:hypothetical protein
MSSRRRSTWAGRDALALTDDLDDALEGLPPTRVAPTRINAARAQLDLGDRDGALENLSLAFDAAPPITSFVVPQWGSRPPGLA